MLAYRYCCRTTAVSLSVCLFPCVHVCLSVCVSLYRSVSLFTSAEEVMFLPEFVCLSVCEQDNSKSSGRIFLKFSGNVGYGKNYQGFNFGGDPEGILDSGSL